MNQKTIDTLIELNKLYEAGILTKEEIEAEKEFTGQGVVISLELY